MEQFWRLFESGSPSYSIATLESTVLSLAMAFILGQALAWAYCWTHSGLSYSRSFAQSLILIAMVVALVMIVIGNNIITAFGLLGALAIIRFRNVLKDTRDTVFIFSALVIGMAVGSQRYVTAIVGTVILIAAILYVHFTAFGTRGMYDGHLRCLISGKTDLEQAFKRTLIRFCRRFHQVSIQRNGLATQAHYIYQVQLRDKNRGQELIDELRKIEGIENVSLMLQDELQEV